MAERLRAKLSIVFRDVRRLFRLINTFSPCEFADPSQLRKGEKFPLPKELGFEFCSLVSHLLVIKKIHQEFPERACEEAEKAGRHATRALLDYVKFHAIKGPPRANQFRIDSKVIQARLAECDGIGTNHNGAMDLYLEILDLHYGKRAEEDTRDLAEFPIEIDGEICKHLETFFKLETVYSGLRGEKLNEVLSDFLRVFSLRLTHIIPHIERICRCLALQIMTTLSAGHLPALVEEAKTNPDAAAWLKLRKEYADAGRMGKREVADAMVIDLCFSLMNLIIKIAP